MFSMAPTMVRTELAQRGPPAFSALEQTAVTDGPVVAKYPKMAVALDYSREENRLATFRGWPPDAPVSAKKLAQGGFVCISAPGHLTKCFKCGLEVSDWKIADSVVDRHRAVRPNCAFVRSLPSPRVLVAASPIYSAAGASSVGATRVEQPMQVDSVIPQLPRVASAPFVRSVACEPVPRNGVENDMQLRRLQASEEERFNTFSDWPLDFLPARTLAQAGFYYLHEEDKVRCAFCKGTVHNWEPGDDPLREHARHYPCCPFLLNPDLAGRDECGHTSWQRARSAPEHEQLLIGHGSQGVHLKGGTPPSELSGLGVSVHVGPKHPSQASPDARLRTFEKWPATCPKRPQELVPAGFFYIGLQDYTKCFHCDGGLCNWDATDDPWEEHARWFPRCQFVLLSKGETYVEDCLQRHQSHLSAVAASTSSQGQSGGADEGMATELAALMRSEDVQFYLSQGVPAETLRAALIKHMRSQGRGFASRDELLQVLGQLLALPRASADQTPQPSTASGVTITKLATNPHLESVVSRTKHSSPEGLTEGSESSDLALENLRLKDQRLCKVCLDAEVGVVFLPCGHLVACPACASALSDCPVCRASIRGTVRTFFS
ncbi:putative inhibitor of apoptosis isoform X2 [Dermacentor variabilis]|uniref:putative inhibitor of apoptosis isoform X2 n=1 Tax=Dermacentor variabilis TaxID=34621 RepID=UPI003F5C32AD